MFRFQSNATRSGIFSHRNASARRSMADKPVLEDALRQGGKIMSERTGNSGDKTVVVEMSGQTHTFPDVAPEDLKRILDAMERGNKEAGEYVVEIEVGDQTIVFNDVDADTPPQGTKEG